MRVLGAILVAIGAMITIGELWTVFYVDFYRATPDFYRAPAATQFYLSVGDMLTAVEKGVPIIALGAILFVLADRLPKRG